MRRTIAVLALAILLWAGAAGQSAATSGPALRMAVLQSDIHHLAFWVAMENVSISDFKPSWSHSLAQWRKGHRIDKEQ